MNTLLAYLNGLLPGERDAFATNCGTSVGYLRKACSIGQKIGADLCIEIERESGGRVRSEDLRPDVDWAYLRATDCCGVHDSPISPDAPNVKAGELGETLQSERVA